MRRRGYAIMPARTPCALLKGFHLLKGGELPSEGDGMSVERRQMGGI